MQGCLTNTKINPVPFMIAHMSFILKKGGLISFGGLVTSIARALGLDTELATLEPLPPCIINLNFLKAMRLCKVGKEGGFHLMINGTALPSVIPCTPYTNVRFKHNWTYDLSALAFTGPLPPNFPLEEGNNTDDEYDLHEQSPVHNVPPTHTTPSSSNPPAGSTPGFYVTEDM